MSIVEAVRIAFVSLLANKLRSILTMLGIIIGVGAVIALLSLGGALQTLVTEELEGLGSHLIFLFAGTNDPAVNDQVPPRLTNDDVAALADPLNVPAVAAVAPAFQRRGLVAYRGTSYDATVVGVTPSYIQVRNAEVARGMFLDEQAVQLRSRVAVLGHGVLQTLFPESDPIGQRIRIDGVNFRVIGVMTERGGTFASNEDEQIFIPLTTAQDRLFAPEAGTTRKVEVSVVYIQARDDQSIEPAIQQITGLLRQRNNLTYQDSNFTIVTQQDLVASFATITGAITIFLGAIAAISLVVGGIGIMNIMLVSVTERTREIGLRKAVGARRGDIRLQFLVEATVLSLLGGLLGIALGYGLAQVGTTLLSSFSENARAEVQVNSILLATLTSILIGIFFGLYPAVRASQLNPIQALRYE
ncbi:MAG: FtsX-like permease family protein [Chloroflexaceae bacterium]|nr:FtsX-like permease family protein [Chloroflexaceae bacterium]NJO05857.1 FtsX-like permease family protein [Chloroflexaceae bacterium]